MNKLNRIHKSNYPNILRSLVENRNNYYLAKMRKPAIAENENPFTMIGLFTAIINDLNDLRKKVEVLEMKRVSQNPDNLLVKEENPRND